MVDQQPFRDDEAGRLEVHGWPERAVCVLVDGLQYGLVLEQMPDVLGQHVNVVALRVERGDAALGALAPVVAVVVVGAEVGDPLLPEHADDAAGDRRLPGAGVTRDAENDRPGHHVPRSGWMATNDTTWPCRAASYPLILIYASG